MVRESRAAFIYARDSGGITPEQLRTSVLVIDIGSSTTDLTHVSGTEARDLPVGAALGASLIDNALMEMALAASADADGCRAAFRFAPPSRARCRQVCRRVKEKYFQRPRSYATQPARDDAVVSGDITFRVAVNRDVMDRALAAPLAPSGARTGRTTSAGCSSPPATSSRPRGARPSSSC